MNTVNIKNIIIGEGMPKICVPLMGKTDEELLKGAKDIVACAKECNISIVEFRGDFYEKLDNKDALKNIMAKLQEIFADIVFLFTIRSHKEGGEKLGFTFPTVNEINAFVIENKLADMVDVELFSGEEECKKLITLAKKNNVRIIMSNHDFNTTPDIDDMVERIVRMQEYGVDIAKIAVMPEDIIHVANLLKATTIIKEKYNSTPVVTISMGKLGAVSRISGQIFGSAITFATLGKSSAPGQLAVEEMKMLLENINSNLGN